MVNAAIKKIQQRLGDARDRLFEIAEEAVDAGTEVGFNQTHQNLYLNPNDAYSTTATGRRRLARGGQYAGRYDTGNMAGAIRHSGDGHGRKFKNSDAVIGWYGWPAETFEPYFAEQEEEYGSGPGALSVLRASHDAQMALDEKLGRLVSEFNNGRKSRA